MENRSLIQPEHSGKPAILVGIQSSGGEPDVEAALDELESLLTTLGVRTSGRVVQRKASLSARLLIGPGKAEEIREVAEMTGAGLVVVDHALSGPQTRNLEKLTSCQVLDRAGVILDIFARHARSRQAKTQVEIAQLEYLLPRLTGAWTHFQRQTGGGVRARGMGETQIEVDRRRARQRIARLSRQLENIRTGREVQSRARGKELRVSIVGYTNSGKTTLMKGLTRSSVNGKDELFATLDASIRVLDPSTRPKILISDTVGFIRNLPHSLIESFRSTLDEVIHSDLLLHLVDVSHPEYQDHIKTTESVLNEIGAGAIPSLFVFNKLDLTNEKFLGRILCRKYPDSIAISAKKESDVKGLREHLFNYFKSRFKELKLLIPAGDAQALSLIYKSCIVIDSNYELQGSIWFRVRAPAGVLSRLERHRTSDEPGKEGPL